MKKIWIVLIIAPIVLVIVVVLNNLGGLPGLNKEETPQQPNQQQENISKKGDFASKTDDQGEVSVKVSPKGLEVGKEAVFEVVLDTHFVPLDFDLTKISKLTDDQGNVYQPISWSGGSGGHHLSGTLSFPQLPQTKFVEFSLSEINKIDRNFRWDL